ncbi:ABC transporter permease [Dyella nitratireducens]|uniref:ABC transporter permease n=1 Tax=Dyella nitratireducens TaxID=1849580 RepID=A0ABQ1FMG1_9GAMM|nr:FtsX-like permease family protein [Dyella nitratireducens]GGA22690.1 ABC transporter permease [Dyella nitratireducens]GLQ44077.1 ABC transporter permease [Dyella nitratireducens]
MDIQPILAALRRHKAGTILIALQIALTLAIVCNALFIIHQRLSRMNEPSGVDEANIFVIQNLWGEQYSTQEALERIQEDLAALRQVPGVQDVTPSNQYPFKGGGWDNLITLKPDQRTETTDASYFAGDEHFLGALGEKLIAGRDFRPDEVQSRGLREKMNPSVAIVSKPLADKLYPHGDALGKSFYAMTSAPVTIVGIVDVLQRSDVGTWSVPYAGESMVVPIRMAMPWGGYYIVRTKPGQLTAAMRAAPKALYAENRMRMIDSKDGVLSFAEVRHRAFERDRGMAILMSIICAVLLAITAAGIVGLTSFWVGQRRRQIGVRRALGATHRDILSYFMTENLLISLAGVALGVLLTFGLNLWLVTRFTLSVLPLTYVLGGIVILLLLGQGAVFAPALRASRVPPIEATRPA